MEQSFHDGARCVYKKHLTNLQGWTPMNRAFANTCMHVFVMYVFISQNKYLGVELLGHRQSLCLTLEENPQMIFLNPSLATVKRSGISLRY